MTRQYLAQWGQPCRSIGVDGSDFGEKSVAQFTAKEPAFWVDHDRRGRVNPIAQLGEECSCFGAVAARDEH